MYNREFNKCVSEAAAEYGVALARAAGPCSGDEDLKADLGA